MSVVKGKNMFIAVDGKVIACLRSCTLTTSTSFIETTTAGSGTSATFKPQKNNTTGSAEGVTVFEAGKKLINQLRKSQIEHELLTGYYQRTDESGNIYTDEIDFYISNISETGAAGDFATFQIDFQITGEPVQVLSGTCAPTGVTWQSTPNGDGTTQDIVLSFTPGVFAETLQVSTSTDGTTYGAATTFPNASPININRPLGVYYVKFVAEGCTGTTITPNVGNS